MEKDGMNSNDLLMRFIEDIAEIKTEIRYIKEALAKHDCADCITAKRLNEHIQNHKEAKRWTWEWVVFLVPTIIAIVSLLL